LDEVEIIMKRLLSTIIVASSLMLVNAAPAAAHEVVRNAYHQPAQYRVTVIRSKSTPSWLKRNDSFKWWYKRSSLRTNRYLTWSELYQVFKWERSYAARRYERSYANHSYDWYSRYWSHPKSRDSGKSRYRDYRR
jgi:hypothetical protein